MSNNNLGCSQTKCAKTKMGQLMCCMGGLWQWLKLCVQNFTTPINPLWATWMFHCFWWFWYAYVYNVANQMYSWLPTSALETGYITKPNWRYIGFGFTVMSIYIYRDRDMTFLISGWNTMIHQSLHSPSFTLWRLPVRPLLFSQINVTYIHVHIHMHITSYHWDNYR
jgi:hypothetical protein